jgi:cell division protein FtsW
VGALFFIAGMRMIWVFGLMGAGAVGLFGAYMMVPHVAGRIKRFMDPASGGRSIAGSRRRCSARDRAA